jgi:hypothetical protein
MALAYSMDLRERVGVPVAAEPKMQFSLAVAA